jgi:DNA-binding MarR family transcriptional regulator
MRAKNSSSTPGQTLGPRLSEGRFAYAGLERAIHEKARLGILTSLVAHPQGLSFNDLKELCSLTDGNLNRHLAVLEEMGLVETIRHSSGGRPQTRVLLTTVGRRRFQQYLGVLEQVVADATEAQQQAAAAKTATRRLGWSST